MGKKLEPFTWSDLKKAVNEIPEDHPCLNKQVVIWGDDRGFALDGVDILEEDFLNDGDEGCAPASQLKEAIEENPDDDFHVVHEKGTRILLIDQEK